MKSINIIVRILTNHLDFGKYKIENNCKNEHARIALKKINTNPFVAKSGKIDTKRVMFAIEIAIINKIIFKENGLLNFIRISKNTITENIKIEKYK